MDINLAHCMQKASHFGFTRVHNVCSSTFTDVPWGVIDWLLNVPLLGFFFVMCIVPMAIAAIELRSRLRRA